MPNYKVGIEIETRAGDSAKDIGKVGGSVDDLTDAFDGSSKGAGGFGDALGGLLSPAGLATGAIVAIGGALIATGAHAMGLAREVEDSTALMTTQLGLTDEKAGAFEETMRSIYENNYGESFTTIAADMVAVEQQLGRIGGSESQAQLQQITEMAIAFGDAFDADVGESTGAAVTLMENFGLSATQAFDFLVAGQQRGLDSSGDFLDSIGEYSVQFSQVGFDAAEFFSILETGNAGGVLGTDKVADAIKEMSIRLNEGGDDASAAFAAMGMDLERISGFVAGGDEKWRDYFDVIITGLNSIEDPIERNKAGVALFGTQWEDLTGTVLTQVDLQKTALEDLEGAAASLEDQYDTTASKGAAAMREWDNALVDVGESLNGLTAFILPGLTLLLEGVVIPKINQMTEWINQLVDGTEKLLTWLDFLPKQEEGEVGTSSLFGGSAPGISLPIGGGGASAQALAGAAVYQTFYIERGDAETVATSAELGVTRAQRALGQ